MAQVRDVVLDHSCEDLAEIRAAKNDLVQREKQAIGGALQRMQQRRTQAYKHAGVELSRVPGADKLRVRLTEDDGDASVDSGTTTSTHDDLLPSQDEQDTDDLSVQ
jgi:hypothetical protein